LFRQTTTQPIEEKENALAFAKSYRSAYLLPMHGIARFSNHRKLGFSLCKQTQLRKDADMYLSLIAAMDEERLIGAHNNLPWRLPADMQWFRKQTMGKPILMGRNTFASIGKALPGRQNIVLSRNRALRLDGCSIIHSLDDLEKVTSEGDEVMIIGGAEVYGLALPLADRIYLTTIAANFEGDAWFPSLNETEWREVFREEHAADDTNAWPYCFSILERIACGKKA